jgi:hypothetical protein
MFQKVIFVCPFMEGREKNLLKCVGSKAVFLVCRYKVVCCLRNPEVAAYDSQKRSAKTCFSSLDAATYLEL